MFSVWDSFVLVFGFLIVAADSFISFRSMSKFRYLESS